MPPEQNTAPQELRPAKMGRWKASKMIVHESWAILKQDKEIMWFPVISTIVTLIAILLMGIAYYFTFITTNVEMNEYIKYAALLVYYVIVFFIANFFQAGLYIIVQARFSGQNLNFSDGIKGANDHIGRIFVWSVISATVGVILQVISDKSKIVGKIVSAVFGAARSILTYFSLPSLIIGNTTIKDSFKESAAMIRKTWGETFIVQFGVGLFFALLMFLGIAVAVGIGVLVQVGSMYLIVGILLVIYFVALSIISTTLSSIFKLALYNYAKTGEVPQGFSVDLIHNAIKK